MSTLSSRLVLVVVVSLSVLTGLVVPTTAQDATPVVDGVTVDGVTVLPPDESYASVTRGEWHSRGVQWFVTMPEEVSPNFDPTGERCGYGQSGPVFFPPRNFTGEPGIQTCVVPEGTAIFVSVAGTFCTSVDPPPFFGRNEAELSACTAAVVDSFTELEASINGQDVPDLESYRASSPLFTLNFHADNWPGYPEGVALSVSEGYTFIIAPPPPGEYEITTSALRGDDPEPFTFTIRYIVQAPEVVEPAATPAATPAS